jgi:hypothetical protein
MSDYISSSSTIGQLRLHRAGEEEHMRFSQNLIELLQHQVAQAAYWLNEVN